MPAIHYMETDHIKTALCSIGLVVEKEFLKTREPLQTTCRSCIHKLMKWTGDTSLYTNGYPPPYIGI